MTTPDPLESCPVSPRGAADAPADPELAALLQRTTTVAVVGMSPKPTRTSHAVGRWLSENTPYELYWVNPVAAGETVLDREVYASLADLPVVPDMVDVFRRSEDAAPVVDEAIAVGAKAVWLQLGISNDEAITKAREAGLDAVQNRCLKVEFARLAQ